MSSINCISAPCNFHSEITVDTSDFILTPISCASLINEIVKNLLYQRSQIPYPYTWLKTKVNTKRDRPEQNESRNLAVTRHFKIASTAYDNLESIMRSIRTYFEKSSDNNVREVVFVLGVTPVSPKEIFVVKILGLAHGHSEQSHILENNRKMPRLLRNIFLSQTWMDLIDNSMPCTNLYCFLKVSCEKTLNDDEVFIPCKPLKLSPKVKQTIINLEYANSSQNRYCCNLNIFTECDNVITQDNLLKTDLVEVNEQSSQELWLESKVSVQGFKDLFINKVSVSELW